MIVARIDGGLGNQMFQAAFGLELAQRHGTELVLDLASYEAQPAHGFLLDKFCIEARHLTSQERRCLPKGYQAPEQRPSLPDWMSRKRLKRLKEKPFGYADRYLRAPDNSYLVGYWQSEQFFPSVRETVRQQFQLRESLSDAARRQWDKLVSSPSLAIHVRRGDYVSNPQAAAIYRNLNVEYYRRAVLARLRERTGVEVTVFSNDIEWCRQNLSLPCPVDFLSHSAGPHEELALMTAAEAMVMANSTFSWWAAWLSQRNEPRIFAPRKWFHPGTLNDRYLACPGWTLLDDARTEPIAA